MEPTQLEPGERVVFRTGLHPMAFSGAAGLALAVLVVVVLLIRHNDLPPRTEMQIALVGGLVVAIGALPALLRWLRTALVLTDRRVLVTAGGLRRCEVAVLLSQVALEQVAGFTGRLLDHGTVIITTPDGHTNSVGQVARAKELIEASRAQQARRAPRRGATPA